MKLWALALVTMTATAAASVVELEHYRLRLPADFEPIARLGTPKVTVGDVKVLRRAWGDVASGCAAVVHEVAIESANRGAIFRQLEAGLKKAGLKLEETGRSDGDRRERRYTVSGEVDGFLRAVAKQGDPTVAVATLCFWSERDPQSCRERCAELVDGLEVTP